MRVVLVARLGDECEPPASREALALERVDPERDAGDGDDADPRVVVADELLRLGVAQPEAVAAALEPESKARRARQNARSRRAASTTRSTEGMYASSICQYGYGTS
jgi:hypothetical protein